MKKLFTMLFVLGAISFVTAQTTYWTETFNDGLPTDWTSEGVEGEWLFGTPDEVSSQFYAAPGNADGGVACFNDDALGNNIDAEGTMTSAEIDLSAVSAPLILEMRTNFLDGDYEGNDETARVLASSDGGTTWNEIALLTGEAGYAVPSFDMADYAGGSVWLQFVYDDGTGWNFGWTIDEVRLSDQVTLIDAKNWLVHAGSSIIMNEALEGTTYYNDGYVANYGLETITSFDITLSSGSESYTQSYDGMEIEYNGVDRYYFDQPIMVEGDKEWTVTISNVNGSADPDVTPDDDAMTFNLNGTTDVDPNKGVVVEEATGTWCPWCTRGTVYLEEMSKRFKGHFIGVAVHNADPMVLTDYDDAITAFDGFPGFPSVVYQRAEILDPSDIVDPSLDDMQDAPPGVLEVAAMVDGSTLTTSLEVTWLEDIEGADHSLAIVVVEDGLSGTDAAWNQANAYGGGGNGPMGGYELFGGSVPAALMTYNHVGRGLIDDFEGENAIEGDYAVGTTAGHIFEEYDIPADMNLDNVHLVGLLLDDDGEIVNAISVTIDEAEQNGFYNPTSNKEVFDSSLAQVYPNPVQDIANVIMSLEEASDVTVTIVNTVGQTVSSQEYGTMSGQFRLNYDMTDLNTGVYIMNITAGDKFITKKINKVD